jgi:pimeloyl-ACP methyl ester carboxylesterase
LRAIGEAYRDWQGRRRRYGGRVELFHQLDGEGEAVVLVHAGICDSRQWDDQWPTFTAVHRVLRIDLRGFGRTPQGDEPYSSAGDVLALLDRLGIERAALVGTSMGGRVALEAAIARPGLASAWCWCPRACPTTSGRRRCAPTARPRTPRSSSATSSRPAS